MNKEELSIKDKIYEETQEFGRVQFVDEIYKLQQEIKILYVQSENKNFFSKKDKISIWLVCHSLIGFKAIFSIYLKLKPRISVFKKR